MVHSITEAFDLEEKILDTFYKERYEPKLFFAGHTECLNIDLTDKILAMLE